MLAQLRNLNTTERPFPSSYAQQHKHMQTVVLRSPFVPKQQSIQLTTARLDRWVIALQSIIQELESSVVVNPELWSPVCLVELPGLSFEHHTSDA
jgi:ATP adenylyltransferase/5',5'''-P-1,P-4-tetraphosphate phosphorylase II